MGLNPGWVFGYVPTPQEWANAYASKVDDLGYLYATPGTGATLSSGVRQGGWILKPPGTIATLTVVAPPADFDGQRFTVSLSEGATIDDCTVEAALGQNMDGGALGVFGGPGAVCWIFRLADLTWYRWAGA